MPSKKTMKVKFSASHLLLALFCTKSITPKSVGNSHRYRRSRLFLTPRHLPIQSARLEPLETPGEEEKLQRNHFEDESFPSHLNHFSKKKTRGAREPKSKPLVEKTKCVRFESCGGWSKFLVPATDIHSQKQL